jgi:hypothetical protein
MHRILILVACLATPGASLALPDLDPLSPITGAWVATLTLAGSTSTRAGHADVYLLFGDSTRTYIDATAILGEHRSDLRSQLGAQPACVPVRGEAEAILTDSQVRINLAPGAADCGLLLEGVAATPDSLVGQWVLPSFGGNRVAGTFVMVRLALPLLPMPSQSRGFGRHPTSPIRLGGGDTEGRKRIEGYIKQLRLTFGRDRPPTFRLVAVCCSPPAPFDAPVDVYELRWHRDGTTTPDDGATTLVAFDTLYFARFELPKRPPGYDGTPEFFRWLPNGRLELDGR